MLGQRKDERVATSSSQLVNGHDELKLVLQDPGSDIKQESHFLIRKRFLTTMPLSV
jgi:hypothetical protein